MQAKLTVPTCISCAGIQYHIGLVFARGAYHKLESLDQNSINDLIINFVHTLV